jgi:hypothetical protein
MTSYEKAQDELSRFLTPTGPVVYPLTTALLEKLVNRKEIPTEAEARENRDSSSRRKRPIAQHGKGKNQESLFGVEEIEGPPPLPADLLQSLIQNVRKRRKEVRRVSGSRAKRGQTNIELPPIRNDAEALIAPAAFYMTLPTLQGGNIPGEARIPLEAIELAQEFGDGPKSTPNPQVLVPDKSESTGTGSLFGGCGVSKIQVMSRFNQSGCTCTPTVQILGFTPGHL